MPVIQAEPETLVWSFAWRTDVHKAYIGTERRGAGLRDPVEKYQLDYLLGPNGLSQEQYDDLRRTLYLTPSALFEVPLRFEGIPATAAITGTSVSVDTSLSDWVAVGQPVWVENKLGQGYRSTINAAPGHPGVITLTLADSPPGGQTYGAGTTTVYPLDGLYLEDGISFARYGSGAGRLQLEGQRYQFRPTWGTGAAALTTFDGYTVLDKRPEPVSGVGQERVFAGLTKHDEGATIAVTQGATFPDLLRSHLFRCEGAADRQYWKKFLHTVKGKQKPFLVATWTRDLIPSAPPGPGTSIVVVDDGYGSLFPSGAHTRLQLLKTNGVVEYTKVTSVVDNGATLTLTVSPAISGDPYDRISFLEVVRLAEDRVTWAIGPATDAAEFRLDALVVQHGADTVADETSIADSAPQEILEVTVTGTTFRYALTERIVNHGGNDYNPVAGGRSNCFISPLGETAELTIRLPVTDPLVAATGVGEPYRLFEVRLKRIQPDGVTATIWWGEASGWSIEGDRAVMRVPNMIEDAVAADLPGLVHQHHCPHKLYDERCEANRATKTQAATVSTVVGRTITVSTVGSQPDQWFGNGGEIVRDVDGEKRMIVGQIGTTLILDRPFRALAGGNAVTFYASCAHKPEACRDKFANIHHYGGFPFQVRGNPFHNESLTKLL